MKKIIILLCGIGVVSLSSCNSGSSVPVINPAVSTDPVSSTQYNLQNYQLTQNAMVGNCSLGGNSVITCQGSANFAGDYTVTFNSGTALGAQLPGAYLLLPTSSESGVTIAQGGAGCAQEALSSGADKYTCEFTISSNGTAKGGSDIFLQADGSLGTGNIIQVHIE